ncbi:MAG: PepSY-associated TM helix domain-containing protein [Phycisphaeraceae bacterium]
MFKLIRTLHIYVSMFGLIALLFFAVTGITLNHPDWFALDQPVTREVAGKVPTTTLKELDKLAVVEALRSDMHITGAVADFDISDDECVIDFKRPGGYARVIINRQTGNAQATIESYGSVAMINDLHMGRDSGGAWKLLIDITALLMVFVSVTGMLLLFKLPKRQRLGFILGGLGLVACVVVYLLCVP